MTGSVITINGRALVEPQVSVLCAALEHFLGLTKALGNASSTDPDRVAEIIAMLSAPPRASGMPIDDERSAQTRAVSKWHKDRVDRVLHLAGIVPESAELKARDLAEGYVLAGSMPIDVMAVRLRRALGMS